jgi:UDP-2-acetamido-3-amino-2,3-dideoxy-glucuronate N-acetyltransferase
MIHPLAQVLSSSVGEGTKVWQFAIILEGAVIGKDCNINCHTLIESKVFIGDRVTIKPGVFIWDGISLENDVMVGPNATFTNDKWPKSKNAAYQRLETKVRKGASIGANATILCGIEIGEFSTIGAGAVVTKSVPNRALMVGAPAKIVGWMNDDGTKMKQVEQGLFMDKKETLWKVVENELIKI